MSSLLRALTVSLTTLCAVSSASAADLRLSANTSAGLSCQIAGARVAVQEGRVGVYGQGAYCSSNVQGQSGRIALDAGLTYDFFKSGPLTGYAMAGAGLQGSNTLIHGDLGVRYGVALIPVEAYLEVGAQRLNTVLQPIVGPRLAVGLTYRVNVGDLSRLSAPTTEISTDGAKTPSPAPVACQLTPEQDAAAAGGAARSAANEALSAAASSYAAVYSNVSYQVNLGSVQIDGNSARVNGSVTLDTTQRGSGERGHGTYGGVVSLVREGCGWRVTGYTQNPD